MTYILQPMTAGLTPLPVKAQNIIMLRRRGDSWMADYVGPHAATIRELFGVTMIPTAWTLRADWVVVLKDIQARNPECVVLIG